MLRRCDIVVIGAGPTGLLLSTLLSALDIDVLHFEKRQTLPIHPRAHFINHRSMEIMRPLGSLAHEIFEKTPPLREWRRFVYAQSLKKWFREVDHFEGQQNAFVSYSPEPIAHLSQNRLLPLMLQRVKESQNVSIEFESEVKKCISTHSGVHVVVHKGSFSQTIDSKFAVIANGANSDLFNALGIHFRGNQ